MELDKRIRALSDILTCFDVERAKEFLGEKGYFADDLPEYNSLENGEYGTLTEVLDNEVPFKVDNRCHWKYFIPECFVKPKEKKYRPYTLQEFLQKIPIGKPIIFRQKGTTKYEKCLIINGYSCEDWSGLPTSYICIGNIMYSLDALFIDYEYKDDYTENFKPFGVEVKE